jgi:hypothetical protein
VPLSAVPSKASTPPKPEASLDLRTFQQSMIPSLSCHPKARIKANFRELVFWKILNKSKVFNLNNNFYYFQKILKILDSVFRIK